MRRVIFLLAPTLLVACERQPVAPGPEEAFNAAVTFAERDVPFTFETAWCGETQHWTGFDHWIEQYTQTPNGRVLAAFRTNYYGTVVGDPSGNVYALHGSWTGREHEDSDGFPYVFRIVDDGRLVGQGSVPNIRFRHQVNITINAPGEVIIDREFDPVFCQ